MMLSTFHDDDISTHPAKQIQEEFHEVRLTDLEIAGIMREERASGAK